MFDQSNYEERVEKTMQAINLMYENIGDELSVEQLEKVQFRHQLLIDQSQFWLTQDNQDRFLYDLKDFGNWLLNYLGWEDEDFNDGEDF
jgi:hypothetical protein